MYGTSTNPASYSTDAASHNGAHTATIQQNRLDQNHRKPHVHEDTHVTKGNHATNNATSLNGSATGIPGTAKPIAIVGMSCRFPGGVTNPSKFWDMLAEGRNGVSSIVLTNPNPRP